MVDTTTVCCMRVGITKARGFVHVCVLPLFNWRQLLPIVHLHECLSKAQHASSPNLACGRGPCSID